MKTASSMRDDLAKLYEDLRAGRVDRKDVKEMTNIAGKIISSAAVQVKYFAERKERPDIAFLNEPESR